jgi:hypothetical protein
VENLYALWTYDEILITVSARQHTPVAQPKPLVTWQGCEGRVGGQLGSGGGKQWEYPYRVDLLRMRGPFGGDDRPVRQSVWREDGCGAWAPAMAGRLASAGEDKEVS